MVLWSLTSLQPKHLCNAKVGAAQTGENNKSNIAFIETKT
jgi:hypothetical protein